MEDKELEMKQLAWTLVGNMSISAVIQDCVDALVEAYKMDEELFEADKELLQQDDATEVNPFETYHQTAMKNLEEDVTV